MPISIGKIIIVVLFFFLLTSSFSYADTFYGTVHIHDDGAVTFKRTETGVSYDLSSSTEISPRLNSNRVIIDGVISAPTTIQVATIQIDNRPLSAKALRRVAIFLVQPDTAEPYPKEAFVKKGVRQMIFGDKNSSRSDFLEISGGRTDLQGEVFGIFSIPDTGENCITPPIDLPAEIERREGISFHDFDHIVWVLRFRPRCSMSSFAAQAGALVNIYVADFLSDSELRKVLLHEFGHNLGLAHSSAIECRQPLRTLSGLLSSAGCKPNEYGDALDLMGFSISNNVQMPLNGWARYVIGLLPSHAIQQVSHGGIFEIFPASASSPGVQALRIPSGASKLNFASFHPYSPGYDYWLEFLQPTGNLAFATFDQRALFEGLTVRLVPRFPNWHGEEGPKWTNSFALPVGLPRQDNQSRLSLLPGMTFVDDVSHVTIRPISITLNPLNPSDSRMKIQICMRDEACPVPDLPPVATYSPPMLRFKVGQKVRSPKVISMAGQIESCAISPQLPRGVTFNKYRCSFSGVPKRPLRYTRFTVVFKNTVGESKNYVSFSVER